MERCADRIVERLKRDEHLTSKFAEPRTQLAVKEVQREFAKRDDEDVLNVSIELLMSYIGKDEKDPKALILGDTLKVIQSLQPYEIDYLSFLLFATALRYLVPANLSGEISAAEWAGIEMRQFQQHILTLAASASDRVVKTSEVERLLYLNCVRQSFGSFELLDVLKKDYPVAMQQRLSRVELEGFLAKGVPGSLFSRDVTSSDEGYLLLGSSVDEMRNQASDQGINESVQDELSVRYDVKASWTELKIRYPKSLHEIEIVERFTTANAQKIMQPTLLGKLIGVANLRAKGKEIDENILLQD